jgi:hypothetical protein
MRKSLIPYFILITCSLIFSFLPALNQVYAYHDDFSYWLFPHHQMLQPQFWNSIKYGRYLGAFVYQLESLFVYTVSDLNTVRLLNVLVIIGCSIYLFKFLLRSQMQPLNAALTTVIVFSLPSFEVMADWAITSPIPIAVVFAILAFSMANQIPTHGSLWQRLLNPYGLGSISLMLIAHLFYPAAATFFWAMAGIMLMFPQTQDSPLLQKKLSNLYIVGFLGIALYFLLFKIGNQLVIIFLPFTSFYHPDQIASNLPEKFSWFCFIAVPQILRLWDIFPDRILPLTILTLIGGAFILHLKTNAKSYPPSRILSLLFIMISLVLLSYLPNLLAVINLSVYRCTAGITTLTVMALIWSIYTYCFTLLPKPLNSYLFTIILGTTCCFGIHQSYFNIDRYRASPSHLQYMYVKNSIEKFSRPFEHFVVLLPNNKNFYYSNDEFGTWFSGDDFFSIVNSVFDELGRDNGWEWVGPQIHPSIAPVQYNYIEKTVHGTLYHSTQKFDLTITLAAPKKKVPDSILFINMKSLYPALEQITSRQEI